ncbi:MAG: hypothetical protein O3A21_09795 [Proteobacteria bacterium]|nr:hypothetical protein [Pseudomonadota bacterium]
MSILKSWRPPALLLLFILTGCSNLFDRGPTEACPRLSILSEAAEITQFREGPGRDLRDVRFQGRFGQIATNCDIENGLVVMRTSIEVVGARGPAATESVGRFGFFVAVTDPADRILAKEVFDSPLEFDTNQGRSGVVEQIEQTFALKPELRAAEYTILIGFQLTRDQLEYNRKNRRR